MSSFDISPDYRPQLLPPTRNIRLRLATRDNYFSAVKTQQNHRTDIRPEDKPCPETMGSRWLEAVRHRNLVRDWGLIGRWYSVILGVGVVSGNMFFCAETKYHRKRCSPNTCRDYAVSIDEYINYIVSNKDWGWGVVTCLKCAVTCEICVETIDIQALTGLHGEHDVRHNILYDARSH
jgi:hypothetical protein